MKKLILITLVLVSVLTAQAQIDSLQLSKNVLEAIKSGKIENLKKLVAPPSVYRELYKETQELTDAEIQSKTSESEKLKSDFENIIADAKTQKIDLKELEYESIKAENPWGSDEAPWSLTIYFLYNGKKGEIALSAIRHKGSWYFMEILMSTNVFKEM